jgi:hypothetical protein
VSIVGSSFFGDSLGLLIDRTAGELVEFMAIVERLMSAWPSMWEILSRAHSLLSRK